MSLESLSHQIATRPAWDCQGWKSMPSLGAKLAGRRDRTSIASYPQSCADLRRSMFAPERVSQSWPAALLVGWRPVFNAHRGICNDASLTKTHAYPGGRLQAASWRLAQTVTDEPLPGRRAMRFVRGIAISVMTWACLGGWHSVHVHLGQAFRPLPRHGPRFHTLGQGIAVRALADQW